MSSRKLKPGDVCIYLPSDIQGSSVNFIQTSSRDEIFRGMKIKVTDVRLNMTGSINGTFIDKMPNTFHRQGPWTFNIACLKLIESNKDARLATQPKNMRDE